VKIAAIRIALERDVGVERANVVEGRPMLFASANRVLMHWQTDALDNPFPVRYQVTWENGVSIRGKLTLHHHTTREPYPDLSRELADVSGKYRTDD
jgi:hypothetical protein